MSSVDRHLFLNRILRVYQHQIILIKHYDNKRVLQSQTNSFVSKNNSTQALYTILYILYYYTVTYLLCFPWQFFQEISLLSISRTCKLYKVNNPVPSSYSTGGRFIKTDPKVNPIGGWLRSKRRSRNSVRRGIVSSLLINLDKSGLAERVLQIRSRISSVVNGSSHGLLFLNGDVVENDENSWIFCINYRLVI